MYMGLNVCKIWNMYEIDVNVYYVQVKYNLKVYFIILMICSVKRNDGDICIHIM